MIRGMILIAFLNLAQRAGRAAALLAVLLGLLPAPAVLAVDVEGLYRGTTEVASRDERERQRALAPAMRQVLIKVSGREDVLDLAPIRTALANPQAYVASYSYRSRPRPQEPGAAGPAGELIELEVSFYEADIRNLLSASNVPLWPRNRPETLVWMVVQDVSGERQVLSSSARHEALDELRAQAGRRGLPLLLPLLDLEDRLNLSPTQLWEFDEQAIREASDRYQVESVLVIRVIRALGGELLGEGVYLFRDRVIPQELYANDLRGFLRAPVATAARELAGYYGVLLSGTNSDVRVRMTVEGIRDPAAYAGLLQYLQGLTDVKGYSIVSVKGETLSLELATGGQIRQLVENIALDRTLQPLAELTREGNEVYLLHYRWSAR